MSWKPIETGPKNPIAEGWSRGQLVWLLIPYTDPSATVGYWCLEYKCWRHIGDDGPLDIQPTIGKNYQFQNYRIFELVAVGCE